VDKDAPNYSRSVRILALPNVGPMPPVGIGKAG